MNSKLKGRTPAKIAWTRDGDAWVCDMTIETKVTLRIEGDITRAQADETEASLRNTGELIDDQVELVLKMLQDEWEKECNRRGLEAGKQ